MMCSKKKKHKLILLVANITQCMILSKKVIKCSFFPQWDNNTLTFPKGREELPRQAKVRESTMNKSCHRVRLCISSYPHQSKMLLQVQFIVKNLTPHSQVIDVHHVIEHCLSCYTEQINWGFRK